MVGVLKAINGRRSFRQVLMWLMLVSAVTSVSCGLLGNRPSQEGAAAEVSSDSVSASQIPVAGSLVFPNSESLSFESSGVVGDVLVSEGQRVKSGEMLVSLDSHRTAQLEMAVKQAQAQVVSAESDLDALQVSNSTLTAQADLQVANAEIAVDEAKEALSDLLQTPSISVGGAQQSAAQAAIVLDNAREVLDDLLSPKEIAVSAAEKRVAAARVELDDAQEAYDDIKDGAYPDEILRDAAAVLHSQPRRWRWLKEALRILD